MEYNEIAELASAKPVPFQKQLKTCPKCGWGPTHMPGLFVRWFDLAHCAFRVNYCKGGQDPEKTVTHATIAGLVEQTVNPICAGVGQDHLHISCTHCGFHFLMESMDAR